MCHFPPEMVCYKKKEYENTVKFLASVTYRRAL